MQELLKDEIVENLPLVLFVVDENFKVQYHNKRFQEIFRCGNESTNQVGKLIRCKTLEDGGECTCQPECAMCLLRQGLVDCIAKGRQVTKKVVTKQLKIGDKMRTLSWKLSVTGAGDGLDYICVIDDVTEIIELSEKEREINRQLLNDMKKARSIQQDFLPTRKNLDGMLDFDYCYRQLTGIGGDFFDLWKIDETRVGVYIADVSGHGMGGGLITVFLRENYNRAETSPRTALKELYEKFNRYRFSEDSYITIFAAVLDLQAHTVTYANAGHGVPMLLAHGKFVAELTAKGVPISNWFPTGEYDEFVQSYQPGDKLMLATDGVTDMRNAKGWEYGLHRLKKVLLNANSPTQAVLDLQKSIAEFSCGESKDDVTALFIQL